MTSKIAQSEADFIEAAHDKLMQATTPQDRAYHRLVKDLSPALMRMLLEAVQAENSKVEMAALLWAFGQFCAANICGAVAATGADPDKATMLATSISEMVDQEVKVRIREIAAEARKSRA